MKAWHLLSHEFQALMKLTLIMECNDFPKSFITEDDYNALDEADKPNYGIKNSEYITDDFRNEHKQASNSNFIDSIKKLGRLVEIAPLN